MADLSELFARDPLHLTREDLGSIIRELREQRKNFQIGDKAAGKAPKSTGPARPLAATLDLQALGLKK